MISCCLNRDRYIWKVRQREAKYALWCEIEFKNSRRPKFVHLHAHWACIHNCLFVTAAVFLSGLFNKHQNPTGASWQRQINFLQAQIVSLTLSLWALPHSCQKIPEDVPFRVLYVYIIRLLITLQMLSFWEELRVCTLFDMFVQSLHVMSCDAACPGRWWSTNHTGGQRGQCHDGW